MANYDFRNLLSAFEFECFSRDLLNAHEGLDLASFAEGRDGGIDLRYSYGKNKTVIVQAKRYRDYSELKPVLKKEVEKVKKLKPTRYMLTTSADLTAANKQEIMGWFDPYIKSEHDILAKQDLNKVLAQHPKIERQYYKLWLASTTVLDSILHKNVLNWTCFERSEIENTVKTYVMNSSFDEALTKLVNNHYVIISGEPGIGKTTLARILVMHLLSEKFKDLPDAATYDEFYYTNSNIEDLISVMQEGKRQVFFFDDFLGQIRLEEGEKNFENRIISFIRACQGSEDKLFILATREYILQQGITRYPNFNAGKSIEFSKCIVDMGKYTRFVRAQILYNHLVANEIPQPYINAVLHDKNYLKIIDHPHFSPRIIETFIKKGTHNQCAPEDYYQVIIGYFDHPDSVWLDAFQLLPGVAQEALLVLNSMGTPVLLDDWKEAYDFFFRQVYPQRGFLSSHEWNNAVKVLQNNFIKTGRSNGAIVVEYHNPGVKDVLTRYIAEDDGLKRILLENAYYVEQVFGTFADSGRKYGGHPKVPVHLRRLFMEAFNRIWDNYRSCKVRLHKSSDGAEFYARSVQTKVEALYELAVRYAEVLQTVPSYVEQKMSMELMVDNQYGDLIDQLSLLEKVDTDKTNLDMDALFENYKTRLNYSDDCLNLATSMEKVFPSHVRYLESGEFLRIVVGNLTQELSQAKNSDIDELDSTVKELCKYVPALEDEEIVERIFKQAADYNDYLEQMAEGYMDDYRYGYAERHTGEDGSAIDNLFGTIKE